MESSLSRRSFIKKSAVALGTVVTGDLTGLVSTGRQSAFRAVASEGLEENCMSHVSVKLWPGRSEQTKQRLADAIVADIVEIIGCEEKSVSVAIEDVSSADWKEKVYDPEVLGNKENLYKKPGYSM